MSSGETRLPRVVFVFSGKRKSGKDHVADLLQQRIGKDKCAVMRLSGPLKEIYAKDHGLDFEELLNSSGYKEIHRAKMIKWGEEKRDQDPSYFCQLATEGEEAEKRVWIISDARRKTDIVYFKEKFCERTRLVRIVANDDVRKRRGFVFTSGVDDAESECGLDDGIDWDILVCNNGDNDELNRTIERMVETVER